MLVGDEVQTADLSEYDSHLRNACSEEYNLERSRAISSYISSRKEMRDFKWYISRIKLKFIGNNY